MVLSLPEDWMRREWKRFAQTEEGEKGLVCGIQRECMKLNDAADAPTVRFC